MTDGDILGTKKGPRFIAKNHIKSTPSTIITTDNALTQRGMVENLSFVGINRS